ncbi:MAG TPA: hypothetical protein PLT03_01400 [Bacillota bacterium]|nr:hypothetical protein [Bacillota bacterium]HOG52509.1 hypothetical protein [Bacillota bacterium]
MKSMKFASAAVALAIVFSMAGYAAATEPEPFPSGHVEALIGLSPELGQLSSPSWLLTGYRYFYDVYYYDKDNEVVDSAVLVYDVVGKGFEHVVTNCYLASFDEDGVLSEFAQQYYVIDFPGAGEFWVNVKGVDGDKKPETAYGVLKRGTFEHMTAYNETGEAWYAAVTSSDGSTDTELYYDTADGLMLQRDDYVYDDQDNYMGGTSYMFYKAEEYYAPWLDFGFTGLKVGMEISYDMIVVWGDGSRATGIMTFYPEENYGSWAYMSQFLESEELGNSTGDRVVSEMCTDGLMVWMPTEAFPYIEKDDVYFRDEEIGSLVKAGDMVDLGELGLAREIHFKDGFFMADAYFRPEDGFMSRYYQYPTELKPFEIILTLRGVK